MPACAPLNSTVRRQHNRMSYDLMVFEPSSAPLGREPFMAWYKQQTQWSENHSYDDPAVTSSSLREWFHEMRTYFPAMNGPYGSEPVDAHATDYCIGRSVVYVTFQWSIAEEAQEVMRRLAVKYRVGFFDVSADQGEIVYPKPQSAEH